MSYHQLPDGRWIVRYYDGPKQESEYFGRGQEAEAAAEARDRDIRSHKRAVRQGKRAGPIPPSSPYFGNIVEAYMHGRAGHVTASSHQSMFYKFRQAVEILGDMPADRITPAVLDRYVRRRLRHVKRTTIHRELSDVQAALNWAVSRGMLFRNPCARYQKPARDDAIITEPSPREIMQIVAHAAPHLARAIIISFYTGIRPGKAELSRLRWSDIDLQGGSLLVRSARKGGPVKRRVPLHPQLREQLIAWRDGCPWVVHYNRRPVGSLKTAWREAKIRAGITRRLRLYDIRHASITLMLQDGADLKTVSEIAGHSRPDITARIYSHTSRSTKKAAIDKLPPLVLTLQKQVPKNPLKSLRKRR